jgi:hypothetical protein
MLIIFCLGESDEPAIIFSPSFEYVRISRKPQLRFGTSILDKAKPVAHSLTGRFAKPKPGRMLLKTAEGKTTRPSLLYFLHSKI